MKYQPEHSRGLTLVELLIVMAAVVILTAAAIPALSRGGLLGGNRVDIGTRELYTALRAAQTYAIANNVETAVLYGTKEVIDSNTGNLVPIADTYIIAKRMELDDLIDAGIAPGDEPFPRYLPLPGPEGIFREMPRGAAVLPDLYEWEDGRGSLKALTSVQLHDDGATPVDPLDARLSPRMPYDPLEAGDIDTFPAHVFNAEGQLERFQSLTERLQFRVGVSPDKIVSERFIAEPGSITAGDDEIGPIEIRNMHVTGDELSDFIIMLDPLRTDDSTKLLTDSLALDGIIEVYFATGRVKVAQ